MRIQKTYLRRYQSGLINKVAITPGNVTDSKGLENVCPDQGAIYADKGYRTEPAKSCAARKLPTWRNNRHVF